MGASTHDYAGLVDELERLVGAAETGTLFVITEEQHSARFALRAGSIVSLAYRTTRGANALPLIRAIRSATLRFDRSVAPPAGEPLPATAELIATLRAS